LWLDNSSSSNPISTPEDNIQYVVKVSNSIGCFDTDTIDVKYFKVLSGFYVPSAFSPNGDGLNDILKPSSLGLKSISSFRIYNRWGQMLFNTSSIGKGWDGKYNGKLQAVDTYVWVAEGIDYANKNIQEKGNVVLLH
jgi:gliding motility-associated-like protein